MTSHLSSKFSSSPRRIDSGGTINGDPYFKVDGVQIVIKSKDGETYLEIASESYYSNASDPKRHFPSMSVDSGQIRISIEDLVPVMLERMDPIDIAMGLCDNRDVREAVVDHLAESWYGSSFDDNDRYRFLNKIKERLHDSRVGRFAQVMGNVEHEMSKLAMRHQQMIAFNHVLKVYGARYPDGREVEFDVPPLPIDVGIHLSTGTWAEARDYWRKRVEEMFPFIADPEPVAETTEPQPEF